MPTSPDVSPVAKSAPDTRGRYLSTRVEPSSPPFFCAGDSVDQLRLSLQRAGERGRYRVFDRQPQTRGVDAELIGQFIVDDMGAVLWKPLRRSV